jgi:hypothetical protein
MPMPSSSCRLFKIALTLTAWLLVNAGSLAQPAAAGRALDRYLDVGPAILACWRPPAGSAGMALTLVVSFKRNGEILGKPRIGFSKLHGDLDLRKRFVASALNALALCTPLKLAAGLGGAIAGRPFAMLFKALAPGQRI